LGNTDQAISDCNKAVAINPHAEGGPFNALAILYFKKGEYDKSWESVHKSEEIGTGGYFKSNDRNFIDELIKASGRNK